MASLWDLVVATTHRATDEGALVSIPTEMKCVNEQGIPFAVHISALQEKKARETGLGKIEKSFNPFLPPDPDLMVSRVGPRHFSVLNKFNVLRHHLLIVTDGFEAQETLLSVDDFEALLWCMQQVDGLGFYNGGTVAGASQEHKHLQLVPLPLGDGPLPTPIDSVVEPRAAAGTINRVPVFDFDHALIYLDGTALSPDRAADLHHLYHLARVAVGVHDETRPYNLLLTRRWMLLVPRSRENWRGVSLNALAFGGSLLVRSRDEFDQLREIGPLAVLKTVVEDDPL